MLLALPMRWVRRWGWASPVVPLRPSTAAVGAAVGGAGFGGQGTALRAGRDCAALRSVGRCGGRALTGAKPLGAPRLRYGCLRLPPCPFAAPTPHRLATLPSCACLPRQTLRLPRLAYARPRLPLPPPLPGRDFAPTGPLPPIAVGKVPVVPRLDVVLPSPPPAACRPARSHFKPRIATN